MRIAITGARGHLGSVVSTRAVARGFDVIEAGHHETETISNLEEICSQVDVVIHCAGRVTQSELLPQNYVLAANVMAAMHNCSARLLNFSTVAVYGRSTTTNGVIDETMPCDPVLDYGKNKLACESILNGLMPRVCHLRIANVFVGSVFGSILGNPLKRFLRGGEYCNLISADDVAEAALHLAIVESLPPVVNVSRDDQPFRTYAAAYAARFQRPVERHLPPVAAHWVRKARGMQSTPANARFSNAVLLSTGFVPVSSTPW